MKLKRITINNFKGVKSSSIAPTALTAFIGPNGAGKSSTEKAIIYGLTGTLPEDAITNGEDTMSVGIEFDTGEHFVRECKIDADGMRNTKIKLNGKTTTQKKLEEHIIPNYFGPNLDARSIRVATSTDVAYSLKADEFGALILPFLAEKFTFEKVVSYCGAISQDAVAKLHSYTCTGEEYLPHTGEFELDDVKKVYYELADNRNKSAERPLLKALVKTLQARALYDGPVPSRTIADIDADLNAIAQAEGAYQMSIVAMSNYNKTMEAIENQKTQIRQLKEQIALNTSVRPNEKREAEIKSGIVSIDESIMRNEKMIHSLRLSVSSAMEMLANLNKNECLCFEGLVCTTDKTCKKTELQERIDDGKESIDLALQEVQKLREQKGKLENELSEYRDNHSMYGRKLLLEKQLASLESNPIQQPIKPEVIEKRDFDSEKKSLMSEKEIVLKYNASIKEKAEYEKKQKELDTIEELVSIFKPKGIFYENVMSHLMGVLEGVMNTDAARLRNGFTIKLVYDEGINVLCEAKPGQGYIPYQSASSGEQVFVIYLIMSLLNKLMNVRILILDDLNHLDKDAFDCLINLLNSQDVLSEYDHIFVSSVNNTDVVSSLKNTGFNIINL